MASNLEMLVSYTGEKQKIPKKTFGAKGGNPEQNLSQPTDVLVKSTLPFITVPHWWEAVNALTNVPSLQCG